MPVKYYSAGMTARLAFAVAICSDPDILLLDEVLAVGDHTFKAKCQARMEEFCASGKTLVLASHDKIQISRLCNRAVWLDRGCIRIQGQTEEVLDAYFGMKE